MSNEYFTQTAKEYWKTDKAIKRLMAKKKELTEQLVSSGIDEAQFSYGNDDLRMVIKRDVKKANFSVKNLSPEQLTDYKRLQEMGSKPTADGIRITVDLKTHLLSKVA